VIGAVKEQFTPKSIQMFEIDFGAWQLPKTCYFATRVSRVLARSFSPISLTLQDIEIIGAPDRIRTCDLCLRSYMFIGYLFDFIEVLVAQTP
jgi:hypothetical protein